MNLTKKNLAQIKPDIVEIPQGDIFNLPEKILQFGTGVLLRALPDYFVNKANRQGVFNGRILVLKSTGTGDADAFSRQDGMYTLATRGLENGKPVDQVEICSAISRVLSAGQHWSELLASASSPYLQIVISNTTETGIQLLKESIFQSPPSSFPAKLLAFLYERFKKFEGAESAGMTIIPTELLVDNGKKLKSTLLELAGFNNLDPLFIQWLDSHNRFCSSLVDRIVPGKPEGSTLSTLEERLGYTDELIAVCEPYHLWAIEGDSSVQKILSFCKVDEAVVIAPDITKFRELKLRMLNATHTLSCGLAYLSGFETVKQAMEDQLFGTYVSGVMMNEIGVAIPYAIPDSEIREFGLKVLDRFRNPYLNHQWMSITMQYSSKMVMRVIPALNKYYELYSKPPKLISMGFAAFLLFMRPGKMENGKHYGLYKNKFYLINDDQASYFSSLWQNKSPENVVRTVFANTDLWQSDLNNLNGFGDEVARCLNGLIQSGPAQLLMELF